MISKNKELLKTGLQILNLKNAHCKCALAAAILLHISISRGIIRTFVAEWLTNNSKVTDSDRERIGLNVHNGSRTPVATPSTAPMGTIDFSKRLQHILHFADESTSRSKAKPDGVHGCEVWLKIGTEPPKQTSEMTYMETHTRTPYTQAFNVSDTGKTAYYMLRWVNTRGKQGPWSTIISAMIVG